MLTVTTARLLFILFFFYLIVLLQSNGFVNTSVFAYAASFLKERMIGCLYMSPVSTVIYYQINILI